MNGISTALFMDSLDAHGDSNFLPVLASLEAEVKDLRDQLRKKDLAMFYSALRLCERHQMELNGLRELLAFAQSQIASLMSEFCPERMVDAQLTLGELKGG